MNPVQRLIVEGETDIHVIANLAQVKGLSAPKSYESKKKFEQQFAIIGNGKNGVKERIPTILKTEGLTNFGIVVDADDNVESTWQSIKRILHASGFQNLPASPNSNGMVIRQTGKPKIGVWLMPDNLSAGYLEHFLKQMISEKDALIPESVRIVDYLIDQKMNLFQEIRRTKAEMYTWLAWQEKPELPFGTSILTQKVFDTEVELADAFITWLQEVFEFNQPLNP